jgi:hypothetical protein
MTLGKQLHKSATHRQGFDPNCPRCLADEGVDGIIDHLTQCAKQNDIDGAAEVAAEQRRMLGILKLYRLQKAGRAGAQVTA